MSERVVIVGASLGGYHTAEALRGAGFDGEIILVGNETHLPYDRPPLSKAVLLAEASEHEISLASRQRFEELEIEVLLGERAVALDTINKRVALFGSGDLAYDKVVIATGSRPKRLEILDGVHGVHYLRTLDDARQLRNALMSATRLLVVGGGVIGAEAASIARQLDVSTTILHRAPTLLSRSLPHELGEHIVALHRQHGAEVRCDVSIDHFLVSDSLQGAVLVDGSCVEADVALVGIGATPNTEWLASSGLDLDDGVVCDATLRAIGVSDVFAVGDVARWQPRGGHDGLRFENWTNAVEQASTVAAGICGSNEPYSPLQYVWSDQYGKRLQIFGFATEADQIEYIDGSPGTDTFVAAIRRHDDLSGVVSLDNPRAASRYRRMLLRGVSWREAISS